jgi:hypothetical protein
LTLGAHQQFEVEKVTFLAQVAEQEFSHVMPKDLKTTLSVLHIQLQEASGDAGKRSPEQAAGPRAVPGHTGTREQSGADGQVRSLLDCRPQSICFGNRGCPIGIGKEQQFPAGGQHPSPYGGALSDVFGQSNILQLRPLGISICKERFQTIGTSIIRNDDFVLLGELPTAVLADRVEERR